MFERERKVLPVTQGGYTTTNTASTLCVVRVRTVFASLMDITQMARRLSECAVL